MRRTLIVLVGLLAAGCGPGPAVPVAAHPHTVRPSATTVRSTPAPTASSGVPMPNRKLTPGAVFLGVTAAQVCVPGYSAGVRNVTSAQRHTVFAEYGIPYALHARYELDHLVSLELGGSNATANLWPEPYAGPAGARVKDRLEDRLHALVCSGGLSLAAAQRAIAVDWWAAYQRYVT